MKFTFNVDADSDIGKAERRAEKRQRREDAKMLRTGRATDRGNKLARQRFFA